jgi:hypothetical protein
MNPEDDQQLWDVLGRAAEPRISPFFARNILRQVRQEPPLRAWPWLRWRILVPASGVALAVIAAAVFMRSSSSPQNSPAKEPETLAAVNVSTREPEPVVKVDSPANQPEPAAKVDAPASQTEPVAKVDVPAKQPEPAVRIDPQVSEPQALAKIDAQDYEVVANLDDLMVLYETSLWDDNSSL